MPVEVLSALFRGRMLGMLLEAHAANRLQFFGDYEHLADTTAFRAYLGPLWKTDWFVYAKRPFAGPEQVLAYLSRYTHRVAISNGRLISADASAVAFKYKDYRIEGPERYKTMTLEPGEFIRRFLMHVLPKGFHRRPSSSRSLALFSRRSDSAGHPSATPFSPFPPAATQSADHPLKNHTPNPRHGRAFPNN